MEVLNKSTVRVKNREKVEGMISVLIKGGASKLQVIADFDHTISRVHKNGPSCDSSYGIIDNSPLVSEEYKKTAMASFAKYHPIEIDPHLTSEEKIPYMIEWYTLARDSFAISGISKNSLVEMVATSSACLRDDCDVVFERLNEHDVPLLIFSAGIGNVLKEVLQRDKLLLPNMKFIANHFSFDENNKVCGFKDELIHTFNKSQSSIKNDAYFEHLRPRNNVILLGDSLGDLDMAAGVKDVNVMLKIGFLNFKIEQNLPEYLDKFDIVLTDDQTMDVVVGLLKAILTESEINNLQNVKTQNETTIEELNIKIKELEKAKIDDAAQIELYKSGFDDLLKVAEDWLTVEKRSVTCMEVLVKNIKAKVYGKENTE